MVTGSRRETRPTFAPVVDSARAVLTSGTWLNACGVLPSWRLATGSHSSDSSPTSLRRSSSRSKISRASSFPADQVQVVGQPEGAGEEGAFGAAQAVAGGRSCRSAGRSRRGSSSREIASTVPITRGSFGGRKPTCGISRVEASRVDGAVGLGEGVALGVEALSQTSSCIVLAQRPRHWSTGPFRPNCSTASTARSNADPGHHLGVHEVPRVAAHLPQPLVRVVPVALELVEQRPAAAPRRCRAALRPDVPVEVQRVEHLAVHVELELAGRGVADPHRASSPRSRTATAG